MTIQGIGSYTRAESLARNGSAAQARTGSLERDSFMELLLLQLRSQDPMNPMDSAAMFNQMAQLSTLEQLWDIRDLLSQNTASQQLAQGASLLGRQVEANSIAAGQVSGLVEGVRLMSGSVWLQIGDAEVRMDEVVSVQ